MAGVAALALALASQAFAGQTLSIRLVRASTSGAGGGAGLEDVLGVLKKNLVYARFSLAASAQMALPAGDTCRLGPYTVRCSGPQNRLAISVNQGSSALLNTDVSLRDGKPLILGGFPAGAGTMVLVFVAR